MIQPLQISKTNFKSTAPNNQVLQGVNSEIQEPTKKSKIENVKSFAINTLKGANNVSNVTQGTIRGIGEGAVVGLLISSFGKNLKENDGKLFKMLGGFAKDAYTCTKKAICFVPNLITKSPLENIKSAISLPKKFYGTYLKEHKGVAGLATIAGLLTLGIRVIQGKIHANEKNANIDHKLSQGHVKY